MGLRVGDAGPGYDHGSANNPGYDHRSADDHERCWLGEQPELAADTVAAVNAYRVQNGLSELATYSATDGIDGALSVDACVLLNTTGTHCDPANLAGGYLTGNSVVNAWIASPEHNVQMLVPQWGRIACAAYTHSDPVSAVVGCDFL